MDEISKKSVRELQTALQNGAGISIAKLHAKLTMDTSRELFEPAITELLEKEIMLSSGKFAFLNPKFHSILLMIFWQPMKKLDL